MSRILRYEVPVDFWAWEQDDPPIPTEFRVIGTGHPFNEPGKYVGTTVVPGGQLVWHLMRRT